MPDQIEDSLRLAVAPLDPTVGDVSGNLVKARDDILICLVERGMPVSDIVARGHDPATVGRIAHLLHAAEYKRRQAAPGVKISERNFGRDRRYPITNASRDMGRP